MVALRLRDGRHYHVRMGANAGFVSCKKKDRNAKNMASAGARAYMGDRAKPPLKLKAFYCRREQICRSHLSET